MLFQCFRQRRLRAANTLLTVSTYKSSNAHINMSKLHYKFQYKTLIFLMITMGIAVVSVEDNNDTFLSNRSMRNLMATIRFDNGTSDADIPHYEDIVIGPRRFGKLLIYIYISCEYF